jgi:cyclopropane fatty-acyl-phospholipid synthase-like methyltransferase
VAWGYGTLASEVYDLDKPVGSSFGDVEFYRRLLDGVEGRVLEPAVGTGRIMIPMLEAGFEVEGYDNSSEMLAVCRKRCDERGLTPVLFAADMTSFEATEPYSAVIVPAGSIALLDGPEALARALRCFRECLNPNGRVMIDLDPPQLLVEPEPTRTWVADQSAWTLQTIHVEYDASRNQTTRWLRYEKWINGVLDATELQIFRLQHWSIAEFAGLLREAGFVDIAVSADYSAGASPGPGSSVWTFDANRA